MKNLTYGQVAEYIKDHFHSGEIIDVLPFRTALSMDSYTANDMLGECVKRGLVSKKEHDNSEIYEVTKWNERQCNTEIMFKALTIPDENHKSKWVKGYYASFEFVKRKRYVIFDDFGVDHDVYGNTVCRCSFIKDKSGNLIFENDIIEFSGTENCYGIVRYGNHLRISDKRDDSCGDVGFYVEIWVNGKCRTDTYRNDLLYWSREGTCTSNIFDTKKEK